MTNETESENITENKNHTINPISIPKNIQNNQQRIKTKLTNQGYHIDVTSITRTKLGEIENDLTMIPYRLDATKEEMEKSKFMLFKYSKNRLEIIVPRYYGICKFGKPLEEEFDAEEIDLAFTQTLREIQTAVCDKCIKYIKRNGGGLLSVPCGFGKTVCAIYIAYRLGLKTLVVVHKSFLIKQWIKEFMDFLGIDISRIGIIRQNKCDVKGKDIVIGMIQTISKREYKNIFDSFGLVIYDEAHHVACKFFSKSLLKTGSQYTLALTATPYRGDGLIKVMYWFLGGTMYRERVKINKNVIVKVINHKSTDPLFVPKQKWLKGKMRADTGKMVTNICRIDSRNQNIINIITHIRRTEPDRKILVFSERIDHLAILKAGVDELIQEDIDNGILDDDEVFSCYYIGSTKPNDRQEAEERGDIIFATYGMGNEGLNIKHLNTVILASPKKDVMQSIGRVMRTILKAGDIRPVIIDFADDIHAIGGWFKIRTAIYRSCKYELENYYLINDEFKTAFEYNGLDITLKDVHHPDPYLHTILNKHNVIHNSWKKDVEKFEDLCQKIDMALNKNKDDDELYEVVTNLKNKKYKVLEDMEYTNIKDILYVPKLRTGDFDTEIIKNVNELDALNLDEDMKYDILENKIEMSVMHSINNKKCNIMPKKRLFK
jgi:superfamily II DNA or RNA helicase